MMSNVTTRCCHWLHVCLYGRLRPKLRLRGLFTGSHSLRNGLGWRKSFHSLALLARLRNRCNRVHARWVVAVLPKYVLSAHLVDGGRQGVTFAQRSSDAFVLLLLESLLGSQFFPVLFCAIIAAQHRKQP